jgi:hypothetical protein
MSVLKIKSQLVKNYLTESKINENLCHPKINGHLVQLSCIKSIQILCADLIFSAACIQNSKIKVVKNQKQTQIMATKSENPKLLSDLLAKAEKYFKVSRNGVKTIERLKKKNQSNLLEIMKDETLCCRV